jgi:hypothetical protein
MEGEQGTRKVVYCKTSPGLVLPSACRYRFVLYRRSRTLYPTDNLTIPCRTAGPGPSPEAVLLRVTGCEPRLGLSAAAVGGTLIAGLAQWVGLVVRPMHDTLRNPVLHVAPVGAQPGTGPRGADPNLDTWGAVTHGRGITGGTGAPVPLDVPQGEAAVLQGVPHGAPLGIV